MWKRIIIACMTLMSAVLIGYHHYHTNISAATMASGGAVTGNLGPLKAGDRFYIFTNNYPFVVVGNDQGTSNMGTLALSDVAIDNILWDNGSNFYSLSRYRRVIQGLNNTIDSRDVNDIIKEFVKPYIPDVAGNLYTTDLNSLPANEMPYFIGTPFFMVIRNTIPGVTISEVENYSISGVWLGLGWTNARFSPAYWNGSEVLVDTSCTTYRATQPGILLNNQNVAFAASKPGNSGSMSSVDENGTDRMQLRMKDTSLSVNLKEVKITKNGTELPGNKITEGNELNIYYDQATVGRSSTISLIVTKDGKWEYYQRLESSNGSGRVTIKTDHWEVGTYNLALVNEVLTNDIDPTVSSLVSASLPITVVEPHKLTYTKTPQSGATSGNDYEFSKNVNAGQTVGKVTANPMGVTPLTYSVETNGDNSYLNFEVDGLDGNGASSSTPLNVKIKSGAPDLVNGGLKAGNYKF